MHLLTSRNRAEQYLAERQQARLTRLAAQADRAESLTLAAMLLVIVFIACL